jgi:hypothetical protein
MTRNDQTPSVDDGWVDHLRDVVGGVVPPTPADPHDLARVAVRRTRARRAVLVAGGGVTAVATVAATAFALGGPTTSGELLPGAAVSASASAASQEVPAGWHTEELEGLTYALPPEIVTSGPVQDEPGETSDMWHSKADPDSPPFLRIAHITPDYEFYTTDAGGLTQIPGSGARHFDLPGAEVATVEDGDSEELREIMAMPADGPNEPIRIIVHRADGPGRYLVTMNVPEGSDALVEGFVSSLSLD